MNDRDDINTDPSVPLNVRGEASISGSAPDPESDDNVLDAAHQVGLSQDATEEHPKPLNIAKDVNSAEQRLRHPPPPNNNQEK